MSILRPKIHKILYLFPLMSIICLGLTHINSNIKLLTEHGHYERIVFHNDDEV